MHGGERSGAGCRDSHAGTVLDLAAFVLDSISARRHHVDARPIRSVDRERFRRNHRMRTLSRPFQMHANGVDRLRVVRALRVHFDCSPSSYVLNECFVSSCEKPMTASPRRSTSAACMCASCDWLALMIVFIGERAEAEKQSGDDQTLFHSFLFLRIPAGMRDRKSV